MGMGHRMLGHMIIALLAAPAAAAGVFTPPAGCTLQLTVQERSCSVAQHYTCAADKPGERRVTYFAKGGVATFESHIDAETRWLDSRDPDTDITDVLEDGAADDASLSGLIADGRDSFDFWTVASDGVRLHHVGEDVLTGDKVTVDGEPLLRTRFVLTTTDETGRVLIRREGNQHVSPTLRLFFGGVERVSDWTGKTETRDRSPAAFARPGEAGFGATEPQYDCELLTAMAGEGVR